MSYVGCTGTVCVGDTHLNSRTLNILLETNAYTCQRHREFRDMERRYISKLRRQRLQGQTGKSYLRMPPRGAKTDEGRPSNRDVYEYVSSDTERAVSQIFVSPAAHRDHFVRCPSVCLVVTLSW